MQRTTLSVVGIVVTALVIGLGVQGAAGQSDDQEEARPRVRMARATWDTGWFQAEVYKLLLQHLGFEVDGPVTMDNPELYAAVAGGEVDMWPNGWFPLHDRYLEGGLLEAVGTQVDDGALQGYFVDIKTAETHGITTLADLSDPGIAALFDADGDGLADLVGCEMGWSCSAIIDHHLEAYDLAATVEHVQGAYSPLISETIDRYRAGHPVLFYTWTPNWTVGELVPGRDVMWLEVPFPSLPDDQAAFLDRTIIPGIVGCRNDPCQVGWPPNDIRVVANSAFLNANPAARRLLEQVVIPLADISAQNALMVEEEGDPEDIRRHAEQWVSTNQALVRRWIETADPDAESLTDPDADTGLADGVLRVAARVLPPFVTYESLTYDGFEVGLVHLIGTRLGMDVEIYAVDTVAKQIDDIARGVAHLGLGGVAITGSRESTVDFSLPVLDTGLAIMVPTHDHEGVGGRILSFFRAIAGSDLPWLIVVFAIAVLMAAHLIWWFERHHNPDFSVPYRRGIFDSFYWSVVTMSTVGYGDKVARGRMGKIFALLWIFLGTLVFASFTAAISSSLAVSELRGEIAGPSDLPGHRVATVARTAGAAYLENAGIGPVLVDEIEDAYRLLNEGDVDAVVFDAPVLRFHVSREGAGAVTTVGPDFDKVQYGLMTSEENSELRERLNLALLDLIESGVYLQVYGRWFGASD